MIDPEGKGIDDDHWKSTAYSLLTAVILHVCIVKRKQRGGRRAATFADVERWFGDPGDSMDRKLEQMRDFAHIEENGEKQAHPTIAREAQSNLDRAEKERSSVISSALRQLTLYRDPIIARATGRSDWTIDDLMQGDRPATAYLVVRPADIERLRPLIRLILTQIIRRLTADMEYEDGRSIDHYKHRLLLLLDEFTALKRLGIIEDTLRYMAGYGIKAMLILQDMQQLEATYGRLESILGDCTVRIAYAPNRHETAKALSEWAGERNDN